MTAAAGATYTYNVQGLRTKKTAGSKTANFTLVGGKVVSDGTSNYFWATELVTNGSVYYLYNAHGDVIQLLNSNGEVTKTYDYDAYGNELTRDLNDSNPFRYCGEYYDTETGFIYLRARYYNPNTGRFISKDTHWNVKNMIYGDILDEYNAKPNMEAISQSSNQYAYGINNPLKYTDPTGTVITPANVVGAVIGAGGGALLGTLIAEYYGLTGWKKAATITGFAMGGAVIGWFAGPIVQEIAMKVASKFLWSVYKTTITIANTSYAIGRAFEEWFYKAHNIVQQQVRYANYRFDAIYKNCIYELKNYDWGKYNSYVGLAERFKQQAQNYMTFIGEIINGEKINDVVFYFSSKPPDKIIEVLEEIGVIVEWSK